MSASRSLDKCGVGLHISGLGRVFGLETRNPNLCTLYSTHDRVEALNTILRPEDIRHRIGKFAISSGPDHYQDSGD